MSVPPLVTLLISQIPDVHGVCGVCVGGVCMRVFVSVCVCVCACVCVCVCACKQMQVHVHKDKAKI